MTKPVATTGYPARQGEDVAAHLEQAGGDVLTPEQVDAYLLTAGGLTPPG